MIRNLTTANAQGVTGFDKLRGIVGKLPGAFSGTSVAAKGLGASLRALALNPLTIALTGVAAVLILVKTNAFGFRDAINAAGKAIGDWLPFLKPVLEGINALGDAMGITGEQTAKAATEGSSGLDELNTSSVDLTRSIEALGTEVKTVTQLVGEDLKSVQQEIVDDFAKEDEIVRQVTADIAKLTEEMNNSVEGITNTEKAMEKKRLEDVLAQKETNLLERAQRDLSKIFKNNISQINTTSEVTRGLTGIVEIVKEATKGWALETELVAAAEQLAAEESERFDVRLNAINSTMMTSISEGADLNEVIANVAASVVDIDTAFDQLDPAMEQSNKTMLQWIQSGATAEQTTQLLQAILSGGLAPAFVDELAPGIQKAIEAVLMYSKDAKDSGMQSDILQDIVNAVSNAFLGQSATIEESSDALLTNAEAMAAAQDVAQNLITEYQNTTAVNREFLEGIGLTNESILENEDNVNALAGELNSLGGQMDDDTIKFQKFLITTNQMNDAIDFNSRAVQVSISAHKEWGDAIRLNDDGTLNLAATVKELARINQEEMARVNPIWETWLSLVRTGFDDIATMEEFLRAMGITGKQAIDELTAREEDRKEAIGESTDAIEEQKNVMEELAQANLDAAAEIEVLNQAIEDGTFAEEQRTAGQQEAELQQIALKEEIELTRGELEFYNDEVELATLIQDSFTKGMEGVESKLIDQKAALAEATGELIGYVAALESGEPQALAFAEGQLAADEALVKLFLQLHQTGGELSRYAEQLADGSLGALLFVEGQQKIFRAALDSIANIADLAGQISALNELLEDGGAQNVAFAEGLLEGALSALELKTEIAAANGEYIGFRDSLISANPELQKFGDLSGFTNEQLLEMAKVMGGSREAIAALTEELFKGAAAFTDLVSSIDFRKIDDEFEDTIDTFREGLDDMIDLAKDNGVKITDEFEQALDFEGVIQLAGEQMHELWPQLQAGVRAGVRGGLVDPSIIDQSVQTFTERMKKALREADVEGEAKAVVDGILTELANLKNIEDPAELIQALANIESKVVALKEGTFGLEDTTNAITSLTQVSPENLIMIAQRISELATAADTLQLTPEQIDAWAQSLSQLTGVPVDQLKAQLEQKLAEAGESATDKFLEAGPGGDAARVELAQQMGKLHQVFVTFTEKNAELTIVLVENWVAVAEGLKTVTSDMDSTLRTNLDSWGTWANNILTAVDTASGNAETMTTSTNRMHSDVSSTLRSNIDSWGRWANDVGTASRSAANSFESAMRSIRSSASSATSAVNRLRSMINSLRSRTITITTRFRTIGSPPSGFQHGGSFIVDKPSTIAGNRVGEFSKPELVTVTPLSNPNNIQDKSVNINAGSVRRAITEDTREEGKGRGKKEALVETPIILNLDGEVVLRFIQKRLLEFGDNVI